MPTTSRAGARFAHRQRADMLAADQLGQIFLLLLVIAPAADLVDAEVRVRAVAEADRGRGARHFLLRHDMLEIAEAEPAILLLDRDPVQPELAHLRPQMPREFVLLVDLGGDRRDLVGARSAASCRGWCRPFRRGRNRGRGRTWSEPLQLAERASRARRGLNKASRHALCAAATIRLRSIRHGHHRRPTPPSSFRFARTPMGAMQGALADASATDLGATAVKAAVERAGVSRRRHRPHLHGLRASRRPRPGTRPPGGDQGRACPSRSRRPPSTRSADRACRR